MQNHLYLPVLFAVATLSCAPSKKPTAAEICKKFEEAAIASGCKAEAPGGLTSAAKERATFVFPGKDHGGQVLVFDKPEFLKSTMDAFAAAAVLAGRHQYGNEKALVFVQLNAATPEDVGAKAKSIVDGL